MILDFHVQTAGWVKTFQIFALIVSLIVMNDLFENKVFHIRNV